MIPLSDIRTAFQRAFALLGALALCPLSLLPQQLSYTFNRPFTEDQSLISAAQNFDQDSQGFLWLTSRRTLHRYDGVSLETIATLKRHELTGLASDSTGTVWLGTLTGGLRSWDPKTGELRPWLPPEGNPALSNNVTALAVDARDRIWVAMSDGIIFRIDPSTKLARTFRPREIDPGSKQGDSKKNLK